MPYYAGDFYARGDYYAGDPGIGRFLKRAVGGFGLGKKIMASPIAQTALSVIPGGGAVARVAGTLSRAASMGKMIVRAHPAGTAVAGVVAAAGAAGAIMHHAAPAGAGMGAMGRGAMAMPGGGMRGFHVSRQTGAMVRNRRMRVTNPKALRRAIRRAQGFARLARKVMHFVSPKPVRGRAIFRARRRTAARRLSA